MNDNVKHYPNCHMRTALGNCDPIGGFCTSVNESVCEGLHKVSRPQGEWITYYPPMSDMQKSMCGIKEKGYVPDKRFGRKKCSLCGCGRPMYEDNYCPNCGARMKGVEDESS